MIIYKFTQGNLGAKKIARSRFQSPVKKKIAKRDPLLRYVFDVILPIQVSGMMMEVTTALILPQTLIASC
jgi:hypothetical protein